ncbi:hypothetical protein B0I35DRAFT_404116 [Stachybotrys elegans]|uniref:BED-type domain-containing protein n=1 Tax=Stachybotrys elegans TaxID=80388 RepID=A0A8K0WWL8_9HYPO|nr:hypothetical protein B0I35DRAFT_404116 [Stachybotrys elegans]
MPSVYRSTPAFLWYNATSERPAGLPNYEIDGLGRVVMVAGEVFCRFHSAETGRICTDSHRWSSLGALKKHLRDAHKVAAAPSSAGSLSSAHDQKTADFYHDLKRRAEGEDVASSTPRKPQAIANDAALFTVPGQAKKT